MTGHKYENGMKKKQLKAKETASGKIKCPYCTETFDEQIRLASHLRWHHPEKIKMKPASQDPLQCPICSMAFGSKSALAGHMSGHAKRGESFERKAERTEYKCEICDKSYPTPGGLYYHLNKSKKHRDVQLPTGNGASTQPKQRQAKQPMEVRPVHFCPNCGTDLHNLAIAIATAIRFKG